MLVEYLYRPLHHPGRFLLGATLALHRFTLAGQTHLNGVARLHRFDKAQVFHAIVGDNRPDAGIDKQPGCRGDQEVTVDHALAKNGVRGGNFVHMGIEVIAAEAGKIDDIRFGQGATRGQQAIARLDLFKIFTERMNTVLADFGAANPLQTDGGQHRRAALNRGALHIVFYRAQTAELFAAAGTTRPAMNQLRQR